MPGPAQVLGTEPEYRVGAFLVAPDVHVDHSGWGGYAGPPQRPAVGASNRRVGGHEREEAQPLRPRPGLDGHFMEARGDADSARDGRVAPGVTVPGIVGRAARVAVRERASHLTGRDTGPLEERACADRHNCGGEGDAQYPPAGARYVRIERLRTCLGIGLARFHGRHCAGPVSDGSTARWPEGRCPSAAKGRASRTALPGTGGVRACD